MIKIDESLLNEKDDSGATSIERHIKWFLEKAKKRRCKFGRKWTRQEFLERILKLDKHKSFEENIKPYIVGNKNEIETLRLCHKDLNGVQKKKTYTGEEKSKIKQAKHILEAFGYEDFCETHVSEDAWDAYKFCRNLKVDVCPYCNRQYIFTVMEHQKRQHKNNKECLARPEIDHFYPKSIYPYLSCNLYNFIPSCHVCNNTKSDSDDNQDKESSLIYPYQEEFGSNGLFRAKIKDDNEIKNDGKDVTKDSLFEKDIIDKIRIAIDSSGKLKDKVEKSKQTFHLEEFYNMHKLEINDFFTRYKNYRDPKRKEFIKLFQDAAGETSIDKTQLEIFINIMSSKLEKQILGMYEVDENVQYPLKKMKTDLKEQLDKS